MRHLRHGAAALGVAALVAGGTVLAPAASADDWTVTIVGTCSANRVSARDTIALHADGSFERTVRLENHAGIRRRAAVESHLHPNSIGNADAGWFRSREVLLGAGLFRSDTETIHQNGTANAGWASVFPLLRAGGIVRTGCAVESNIPFDPRDFDGLSPTSSTWNPQ